MGTIPCKVAGRRVWLSPSLEVVRTGTDMLVHRPFGSGSVGRSELVHRADRFAAGRWAESVQEATQHQSVRGSRGERTEEQERERATRQRKHECNGVKCHGRAKSWSVQSWQKDETTLNELQGRRPQLMEIPADVVSFEPEIPAQLDRNIFATCLRGSPSG